MNLYEACDILEIDPSIDNALLKEQFNWFVKFYHPDNKETGDVAEFRKIVEAYRFLTKNKTNDR